MTVRCQPFRHFERAPWRYGGITASADNETLSLEISGPIAMRIIRSEISPRPFALVEMTVVRGLNGSIFFQTLILWP